MVVQEVIQIGPQTSICIASSANKRASGSQDECQWGAQEHKKALKGIKRH
jgi:hypothetical protein